MHDRCRVGGRLHARGQECVRWRRRNLPCRSEPRPNDGHPPSPEPGGWQQWQTVTATVTLAAGVQQLRVVLDTNGSTGAVGNLDYLRLTAASPPGTPADFSVAAESIAGGGPGVLAGTVAVRR